MSLAWEEEEEDELWERERETWLASVVHAQLLSSFLYYSQLLLPRPVPSRDSRGTGEGQRSRRLSGKLEEEAVHDSVRDSVFLFFRERERDKRDSISKD